MIDEQTRQQATNIKLLICDVDGVLTDGKVWFHHDGTESKSFNTQDGLGLKRLQQSGIQVAVITGRKSECVRQRMQELGIKHLHEGQKDKTQAFEILLQTLHLTEKQVAYIGDDLPDLVIMQRTGLSIAVANAVPEVLDYADWHTTRSGGDGAVREACDMLLRCQHHES